MSSQEFSLQTGVSWGFRAAIIAAALALVSAFISPLTSIIWAPAYFAVAWGVRRRQLWAAIAGSCFTLVPVVIEVFRIRSSDKSLVLFLSIGVQVVFGVFFLWATLNLRGERSVPASVPWISLIAVHAMAALCLRAYQTPTKSMENTLLVGDGILADEASWFLGRTPKRGDIIVFRFPGDRNKSFVKRVVGIPGDRLHTHERKLYRNGSEVVEDYAVYKNRGSDPRREFPSFPDSSFADESWGLLLRKMLKDNQQNGEIVVPDGEYFVLGDNRDNSLDSRHFGFVNRSDIVASPLIIFASYEIDPTADSAISRTILNMRWSRILKLL
jgi:signal peptidase I